MTPLDHIEDIVMAVFQYIAMLKRDGPQEWVFQECAVSYHKTRVVQLLLVTVKPKEEHK